MKPLLTIIIILFSSSFLIGQGKRITFRSFLSESGFCSNSVILNSNGTYTEEGGCEGRSKVYFGLWTKTNDTTISLNPNSNTKVINSITYKPSPSKSTCKTVRFKVVDITDKPVYSFDIEFSAKEAKTNNSLNRVITNPKYSGQQIFETDVEGNLEVNFSTFDSVEFKTLKPFQSKNQKYSLRDMEGKIVYLKLNANRIAFAYPETQLLKKEKPTTFILRKKAIVFREGTKEWILSEQ